VGIGDERERGAGKPWAAPVQPRTHQHAEEQQREADAVGVRELAGESAGDRAAPDRRVLDVEEDERGRGRQERRRKGEPHQAERRVGKQREQEDAERGAELERDRHPESRRQRRHHEERERKVVEQQRVAEV
jgi:hypothetical protein